jgi:hypothetical protein
MQVQALAVAAHCSSVEVVRDVMWSKRVVEEDASHEGDTWQIWLTDGSLGHCCWSSWLKMS